MEFANAGVRVDAITAYATAVMALLTIIIFITLLYCSIMIKKMIDGMRIYLRFSARQQAVMNKNIINLIQGDDSAKEKAKKELDVITGNMLNDIDTF